MAPRKAAKHSDTEIVDKAAEAGDVSPPKRKKTTAKSVNKNEEEKQIRLPRAAKSTKIEQFEAIDTNSTVTKNTKTKGKTSSLIKNVSIPAKANSKVKTTGKKNKESEEKGDMSSGNAETVKHTEETETKKSRTKAATKKAGIDADEEFKGTARGKAKKGAISETTESLEPPAAKKRKPTNTETISKENKPKARTAKKKNEVDTDTKHKSVSNKAKTAVNSENENNSKVDESTTIAKVNKKANEEKGTKPAIARKTRGRKNEASPEGPSKDDELKAAEEGSLEPAQTSDTESQESQNNQTESTESTQSPKRAKNSKKKELTTLQKKAVKTRGKATNRNADVVSNEDEAETLKAQKDVQKKSGKESTATAAPAKKSRARKGAVAATVKDENGEKTSENIAEDKKTLNSSETLNTLNDDQKLLEEDNDKNLDSEKEDTKYTKSLGMLKRTEDMVTFKSEVNENNDLSTSVKREEEN